MKRNLITILLFLFMLSGCTQGYQYTTKEKPHLYWKDIEVEVENVNRQHWFATTHRYSVQISVKNEEYQLTFTEEFYGSGAFGCPHQWEYNEGDIVKAELYSWVMDSTGEVIRREIHRIY